MTKYSLVLVIMAISACSSGGSVKGKTPSELRASCQDGRTAACRAVRQHDQLL
ncbi:hypothetical protein [Paracoccus aestuariivivens]|uniref:Lipoprotein n=1 Tax=Paracoccus aestuariivivens TaxID=1820333 RepID=A0A6L6JFP7_9RHOB|nr:hypothetical protein [Paracoccus aestuariivivens]MTH79569.1 hypothetical protein [Paracoccus aestuariivivens]